MKPTREQIDPGTVEEIIHQLAAYIPPSRNATILLRELRRQCAVLLAEHQALEAYREDQFLKAQKRERKGGRGD